MNRLHGLHRLAMLSAFMALFTISLGGCYTAPPEGLDLIEDSIAVTAGHAADPKGELSPLAEAAFLADHDAWQKARALIYGKPVDAEVQARTDARKPKAPQ